MRSSSEEKVAGAVELVLLVALFVLLGVAAFKFFRVLDRQDVPWMRGLPVGVLFVAAALITWRGIVRRVRTFRTGKGDDITGPENR